MSSEKIKNTVSTANHHYESLIAALDHLSIKREDLSDSFVKGLQNLSRYSPYLSSVCINRPYILKFLYEDPDLTKAKTRKRLFEDRDQILSGFDDKEAGIRKFQWLEMLRIAWRDLSDLDSIQKITEELANLADAVISAVFNMVYSEYQEQYGTPILKDQNQPSKLVIIGMGKLGGRELNFSSDVDLMFVYDGEGNTTGGTKGTTDNRNFYTLITQSICSILSEPTEDGFLYRVDTRLRPEGDRGSVAVPMVAIEVYYHTYGQNWERQSLLKARPVAGNEETGKRFLSIITPFTYRKYVDEAEVSNVLHSIDRMRNMSINQIKPPKLQYTNFKNGYGGIRDIEFFVQAVQMLYGGQYPEIKLSGTLISLRRMHESHLLPAKEFEFLKNAYEFLRKVEHRLQMVSDQQVYILPEDLSSQKRLADSLGFEDYAAFHNYYKKITIKVREIYKEVFQRDDFKSAFEQIIDEDSITPEIEDLLKHHRFEDCKQAFKYLKELLHSSDAHLQSKITRLYKEFLPRLMNFLRESPDPDLTLSNFEKLVSSFKAKSGLFESFCDQPNLLKLLVSVTSTSNFLTRLILRDPSLLDSIGPEGYFEELITPDLLENHYRIMRYAHPKESGRDVLLRVQNTSMFRTGMRFVMGMTNVESMSEELSHIADFVLEKAIPPSVESMADRFPDFTKKHGSEIAVLGFGKLGGQDFNVASDCDVVFVYPEYRVTKDAGSSDYFHRWATKYMEFLQSNGPLGFLYQVDARLRPHGQGSPLAVSTEFLKNYYVKEAQFWEKMALTRARFIAGDTCVKESLQQIKDEVIFSQKPSVDQVDAILEMRKKIEHQKKNQSLKAAPGGLIDVEFISQALVLFYGPDYSELRSPSTTQNIRMAVEKKLINQEDGNNLIESYLFLREIENRLRIVNNVSIDSIPTKQQELEKLIRRYSVMMERKSFNLDAFLQEIEHHVNRVRKIFNQFFDDLRNS